MKLGVFFMHFSTNIFTNIIDKYNYICYYTRMRRKQYEKLLIKGSYQDTEERRLV